MKNKPQFQLHRRQYKRSNLPLNTVCLDKMFRWKTGGLIDLTVTPKVQGGSDSDRVTFAVNDSDICS